MAVKYGKCVVCGHKELCGLMFATVNPVTGEGYNDVFINPNTKNLNHSWTEHGSWVKVCRVCIPSCVGLKMHRVWTKKVK